MRVESSWMKLVLPKEWWDQRFHLSPWNDTGRGQWTRKCALTKHSSWHLWLPSLNAVQIPPRLCFRSLNRLGGRANPSWTLSSVKAFLKQQQQQQFFWSVMTEFRSTGVDWESGWLTNWAPDSLSEEVIPCHTSRSDPRLLHRGT